MMEINNYKLEDYSQKRPVIRLLTIIWQQSIIKSRLLKGGYHIKVDRLVSIIMTLLKKRRIGARELADMFEVSPRTIYRDIETINMAGIPIRSISGVGGGFEIMPEYKIDKSVFRLLIFLKF